MAKETSIILTDENLTCNFSEELGRTADTPSRSNKFFYTDRQLPLRNVSSLVCDAGGLPHYFHVLTKT